MHISKAHRSPGSQYGRSFAHGSPGPPGGVFATQRLVAPPQTCPGPHGAAEQSASGCANAEHVPGHVADVSQKPSAHSSVDEHAAPFGSAPVKAASHAASVKVFLSSSQACVASAARQLAAASSSKRMRPASAAAWIASQAAPASSARAAISEAPRRRHSTNLAVETRQLSRQKAPGLASPGEGLLSGAPLHEHDSRYATTAARARPELFTRDPPTIRMRAPSRTMERLAVRLPGRGRSSRPHTASAATQYTPRAAPWAGTPSRGAGARARAADNRSALG